MYRLPSARNVRVFIHFPYTLFCAVKHVNDGGQNLENVIQVYMLKQSFQG